MDAQGHGRVGIFGGTFNPPHIGHLVLAQDAIEKFNLSQVIFVPCSSPPHKRSPMLASGEHRMAMLEAAIEGDHRLSVSDVEVCRGGLSYAVDTIEELSVKYPEGVDFLIGSDSLMELHLWKDIKRLLTMCEFKVFARPGFSVETVEPGLRKLPAPWPEKILGNMATGHLIEISSSEIRHRIAEGMSIRYLVHPLVEMYIMEHSLYRG